eukprot:5124-Eustigmatos_ZCMA.PRE.1
MLRGRDGELDCVQFKLCPHCTAVTVMCPQSSLSIRGAGAAAERWSTKLGDEAETWVELLV